MLPQGRSDQAADASSRLSVWVSASTNHSAGVRCNAAPLLMPGSGGVVSVVCPRTDGIAFVTVVRGTALVESLAPFDIAELLIWKQGVCAHSGL